MWSGIMDLPIVIGWACETCNTPEPILEWGIAHGVCRCVVCHTQYNMGDKEFNIPICLLKEGYKKPAKRGWEKYKVPISEWDDGMWDAVLG